MIAGGLQGLPIRGGADDDVNANVLGHYCFQIDIFHFRNLFIC